MRTIAPAIDTREIVLVLGWKICGIADRVRRFPAYQLRPVANSRAVALESCTASNPRGRRSSSAGDPGAEEGEVRILIGFRNGPHPEPPSDTVTHAGLWGDGLLIGGRDQ